MNDILRMYRTIEKEPKTYLAEKRVDYLFKYWLGLYIGESHNRGYLFYSQVSDWVYKTLLRRGYKVNFSYNWDRMLYCAMDNNEESSWQFFFECIYSYIEMCGKKQTDKESKNIKSEIKDINKHFHLVERRPGIATGTIEKRVDYVTHYFAGIYAKEDDNLNSESYMKITQWIYESLLQQGHEVEYSRWWHEMIYEVTTDEEKAWDMLFRMIHNYFDEHFEQ